MAPPHPRRRSTWCSRRVWGSRLGELGGALRLLGCCDATAADDTESRVHVLACDSDAVDKRHRGLLDRERVWVADAGCEERVRVDDARVDQVGVRKHAILVARSQELDGLSGETGVLQGGGETMVSVKWDSTD